MTEQPTAPPPEDPVPEPYTPDRAIRALGFDPEQIQAVVLTPTSAVAIAADYPEPYVQPEEAP